MKKKIYYSIIILTILSLFGLAFQFLFLKSIDEVEKKLTQKNLEKIKFLENQLNSIEASNKYLKSLNTRIVSSFEEIIKDKYEELLKNDYILIDGNSTSRDLYSKKNKYKVSLLKYELPFLGYDLTFKPTAFVEKFKNKILITSGFGDFFIFDMKELSNKKIQIKKINSNFKSLIKDKEFFSLVSNFDKDGPKWMSIKDILVKDDYLYISYTNTQRENCYNIKVLKAKINFVKLVFENFINYDECASSKNPKEKFHGLQVGGKMENVNDNKFILSLGDFRKYTKPQDEKSFLGKIYEVNSTSGNMNVISKGVRNPQGIYYDKKNSTLLFTEHGPFGGDEVNIQKYDPKNNSREIINFGWPIASYGNHYDKKPNPDAPLLKNHKDNGFTEPLYYFKKSPGISDITKLDTVKDKDIYIFLTQNGNNQEDHKSMFFLDIKNGLEFNSLDSVRLNNRFRNIISLNKNKFLITGEQPAELFYLNIDVL